MRVFKAPEIPGLTRSHKTIFLAGSIEMGKAEMWQEELIRKLDFLDDSWVVLNPRRDDWDLSWVQSIDNPQFFQQVMWERNGLSRAGHLLFYFAPDTISPITLLELGEFSSKYNTRVVCKDGYQRKGNVEIFCNDKNIPIFESLDELVNEFRKNEIHTL